MKNVGITKNVKTRFIKKHKERFTFYILWSAMIGLLKVAYAVNQSKP